MNLDPYIYPYGVGITLFAAGYLYNGYFGVFFIFSVVAIFISYLKNLSYNPFWRGFLISYLIRIPLAFFRMEETFLYGYILPTLVSISIFSFFNKRWIDRNFTV